METENLRAIGFTALASNLVPLIQICGLADDDLRYWPSMAGAVMSGTRNDGHDKRNQKQEDLQPDSLDSHLDSLTIQRELEKFSPFRSSKIALISGKFQEELHMISVQCTEATRRLGCER